MILWPPRDILGLFDRLYDWGFIEPLYMWLFSRIDMLWPRPFRGGLMRYLGLDAGKRYVQACLLDEDGLEDISLLLNPSDMAVLEPKKFRELSGKLRNRDMRIIIRHIIGLNHYSHN